MVAGDLLIPEPGFYRPYLLTPYVWHGATPEGWDCWGCVSYCRSEHYGRPPDNYGGLYTGERPSTREERFALQAELITDNMRDWKPVDRVPGCAVLFLISGLPVHVGLYLGNGDFLHSLAPANAKPNQPATQVERLSDRSWATRIEGFYDRV